MHPLKENYYALLAAIINSKQSPEHIIATMMPDFGGKLRRAGRVKLSIEVIAEMSRLRQSMTLKQIGYRYGISAAAVKERLARYEGMRQ